MFLALESRETTRRMACDLDVDVILKWAGLGRINNASKVKLTNAFFVVILFYRILLSITKMREQKFEMLLTKRKIK